MVDQLSFESHKTSSSTSDMVMYSSGKSLHLCPLKQTLNMLPKLSHIDKTDPKNNRKNQNNQNGKKKTFVKPLNKLLLLFLSIKRY